MSPAGKRDDVSLREKVKRSHTKEDIEVLCDEVYEMDYGNEVIRIFIW
jgi:hypothetical protein